MNDRKKLGNVVAIMGAQWGDEGKGKLIDILASQYRYIARSTGGANAGHTIYVGKTKVVFHLIPSGMLQPKTVAVIGNGVVVNFPTLFEELDLLIKNKIKVAGRLFVSPRTHIVFDYHKEIDRVQEERKGAKKVGTTLRGIGPSYADKISRMGIRVHELSDFAHFERRYRENVKLLSSMYGFSFDSTKELAFFKKHQKKILSLMRESWEVLEEAFAKKQGILIEGANGTMLDIDHGTYPFVTSSNASIGGAIAGCGIAPSKISSVIGIAKAYVTRVGGGPFPTELLDELGSRIREQGGEYGATTGRPRRCGWFDAVAMNYAIALNGLTHINLTKLDVFTGIPKLKIGVAYKVKGKKLTHVPPDIESLENAKVEYIEMPGWTEDISNARTFKQLPKNAQNYVLKIEKLLGVPIAYIGVGKERTQMIVRL